jgi:hypothetical protein
MTGPILIRFIMKGWFGHFVEEIEDSIHIGKMYKDKEVNKNVKNICLSMCDVSVFDVYIH